MQKKFFEISSLVFAVAFFSFLAAVFTHASFAAWTGPTAPPPANNALAPLDEGSSNQTKLGGLTLGKDLYLQSGLRMISNGGSNYGYFMNVADTLTYSTLTGGAEIKRFSIGNDGNIAIGDLTPQAKLHVAGDIKANGKIYSNGLEVLTSGSVTVSPDSVGSPEVKNGSLTSTDVNTASIQSRVSGTCAPNSSIRVIAQDGTVTCETDDSGSISYTAGTGISISSANVISATAGSETDPTVPANIKDGIDWSELTGVPSGFSDGVDDTAVITSAYTYLKRVHSGAGGVIGVTVNCGTNSLIAGFGCYDSSSSSENCYSACDTMWTANSCTGNFSEEAFIYCIQF